MFASATAVVYTDGSCTGNGTTSSLGGVGVFWGQRGHPYQVSRKASITPATNNTAEFEALEDALAGVEMDQARYTKAAAAASKRGDCTHPPPYSAIIVMDAEYPYNALTQWYDGWKRKGWRTASGTPVANMEILQRVHAQLQRLPVKLYHVIAHGSTAGNQEADALADVYTTHAL
jgi:ribonuclease HI